MYYRNLNQGLFPAVWCLKKIRIVPRDKKWYTVDIELWTSVSLTNVKKLYIATFLLHWNNLVFQDQLGFKPLNYYINQLLRITHYIFCLYIYIYIYTYILYIYMQIYMYNIYTYIYTYIYIYIYKYEQARNQSV